MENAGLVENTEGYVGLCTQRLSTWNISTDELEAGLEAV